MIHTKSLIRRLAYVPWLLAFGLVLGWAGEAQAQTNIRLTVDKESVREDAGATTFMVTATNYVGTADDAAKDKVSGDKYVILDLVGDPPQGLNSRFSIDLNTIKIAHDTDAGSAEITITPIDLKVDDPNSDVTMLSAIGHDLFDALPQAGGEDADNLAIVITGVAGSGFQITNTTVTLIDKDQASTGIMLTFDPKDVSEEAGRTKVRVTATLNGETVKHSLSFSLGILAELASVAAFDEEKAADFAGRDSHYDIDPLGNLTIPKRKVKGVVDIFINPKSAGWLVIGAREGTNPFYDNVAAEDDANTERDESLDAPGGKDDRELEVAVNPSVFTITAVDLTKIKDDGLTADITSIREDGGPKEIELTVTLAAVALADSPVKFTIVDDAADDPDSDFDDGGAVRDVNYIARFEDLTILEDEASRSATLYLTPINDEGANTARIIRVKAEVGSSPAQFEDITITDDDTLTSTITLTPDPGTVQEDAGLTEVTITATLNGEVFEDDLKLTLVLAAGGAQRDVDYTATLRSLTISAGEVSGEKTIDIIPIDDGIADDESITVTVIEDALKNEDEDPITVVNATIKLGDTGVKAAPEDPDDSTPIFTEDDMLASDTAIEGTASKAIEDVVLPEATGDGDLSYSVSANLPSGLSFDPATRTISGTPVEAGDTGIVYTVVDGDTGEQIPSESAVLTYNIEIAETPAPTTSVDDVSATQTSIRENGETTVISITATLAEAAPVAETISFTIGNATDGAKPAVRDVDYTASLLGRVDIEAGDTQATSTLTLTPINNDETDGNRSFGIHAEGSGGSDSVNITIADDETASTSISLSISPHTVAEGAAATALTITATLDGKVKDTDQIVIVSVDPASQATRDVDYRMLFNPTLTIVAGAISGSIDGLIEPLSDDAEEGNESITLNGAIEGLTDGSGQLIITDVAMMDDDIDMMGLAFAEGTMVDDVVSTAGAAMPDVVLPEAAGGSGDIAYSVSDLPAGLSFDPAMRTISGTPEAAGSTDVTYTATDSEGATATLTFSITVNAALEFNLADFFGLFNNGAGKANPAQEDADGALQIVVGQPYNLTLPEVSGGTPPLTYSVSGLPAGLSFDPATRTVSGTATEVSEAVAIIYTATDGSGASSSLPFLVAVVEPPLDAPDALVAEDYKGADGAGDQGGFVLLTWDLSGHHDGIDGYRIFRELPVLGNEMVPWAMVDAVPGVNIGRAIVATLDNVATNWGIAAERGGQTTHGAAKAVFVSGNQPYALMAETLMASREAAQAGDAPVFASLLPEALAFAQGVAPKLNLVAGVLSSAITLTEEPVRATDDIAPLAVPSLSVLDAPNDAGSRILLTWTLSPSDQLLQGVIAEAFGPTALEQVVGVHGYGIYRRAAGEDEFVLVAQVDAGITSFVDETALNGVRYTYQVRPYDLDNETGSDLEQTAMAVRNSVLDSEGRALFGLFGVDNRIGFDDFFIFADSFGLTAEDAGFDPAFDLAPNATIDFDDFFVFADNFGRSTAAAGKRVPMLAGLNADARMYLDARTAMPIVGEDFVLDVRVADFAAIKGYGLQVQYEADKLEFVEVLTDQPLGGSELATPQVLADQAGVLTVAAYGDVVSDGEVPLSLVFRAITEIENTVVEITDNQTYDSEFGFNRLVLPAPVQLQTRPEAFALANNYPNPFNPATTIKYALPLAADVELTVYNVVGQPVRTLVAEHQSAGRYVVEWDTTNNNGHSLASGMYFYRLQAGEEFLEIKKMLLLK